jgi:hypothetical protein
MVTVYRLEEIILGELSHNTAHVVYKNARIRENNGSYKKVIYKENKDCNPEFSRLEVAFTGLASRFLAPNLTPQQQLVKNQHEEVVGVASEHLSYTAYRRESLNTFCQIQSITRKYRETLITIPPKTINTAEDIPVYFFNNFPPGFFATLWDAYKQGKISFDMASLASVLCGSYTLEEDDLHKGNFGFCIVDKDGQKTIVFFKIDNDLMMVDSVMSHCGSRLFNIRLGEHAFEITKRDLSAFPKLYDSFNYYWPTSMLLFANPCGNKSYTKLDEISAFTKLGKDKEFKRAKWAEFYRHILIPPDIVEQELAKAYKQDEPTSRAQLALLKHAVIARQAKLRAVLFTIPRFRKFVRHFTAEDEQLLQAEILDGLPQDKRQALSAELSNSFSLYRKLCQKKGGFIKGDTPLHVAIRLQDFRYNETWNSFSSFAKLPNAKGEKPLDVAVALAKKAKQHSFDDVRQDPFFIIKWLRKKGVDSTRSYEKLNQQIRKEIRTYQFESSYHQQISTVKDFDSLLSILRDLGEDYHFSLKMKKVFAVECMKKFIANQRYNPYLSSILTKFKKALNGGKVGQALSPELQFICQLRSRLWIVRKIRGLLGGTSTQVQLNELIDKELKRLHPPPPSCFSFFFPTINDNPGLQVCEPQKCYDPRERP